MTAIGWRDERGVQAVEFAIIGALLLFMAVGAFPLLQVMRGHNDLGRATAAGLRYATRVEANPCTAGTEGCPFTDTGLSCPSNFRRRPSSDEVIAFVRQVAGRPTLQVTVSAQPCAARSGDEIVVSAQYDEDLGFVADLANRTAGLLGAGTLFEQSTVTISSTAVGIEE